MIANNFSEIERTFLPPAWGYMTAVDSFCLLNEELCSRVSFNTGISKNRVKENSQTKVLDDSEKDLYF